MKQLVGHPCAKCKRRINSVIDGSFCRTCGNAVHDNCRVETTAATTGQCPMCGADKYAPGAEETLRELQEIMRKQQEANAKFEAEQLRNREREAAKVPGSPEFLRKKQEASVNFAQHMEIARPRFAWRLAIIGLVFAVIGIKIMLPKSGSPVFASEVSAGAGVCIVGACMIVIAWRVIGFK